MGSEGFSILLLALLTLAKSNLGQLWTFELITLREVKGGKMESLLYQVQGNYIVSIDSLGSGDANENENTAQVTSKFGDDGDSPAFTISHGHEVTVCCSVSEVSENKDVVISFENDGTATPNTVSFSRENQWVTCKSFAAVKSENSVKCLIGKQLLHTTKMSITEQAEVAQEYYEPVLSMIEQPDFRKTNHFAFRCRTRTASASASANANANANVNESSQVVKLRLMKNNVEYVAKQCKTDNETLSCEFSVPFTPDTTEVFCSSNQCKDSSQCKTSITLHKVLNVPSVVLHFSTDSSTADGASRKRQLTLICFAFLGVPAGTMRIYRMEPEKNVALQSKPCQEAEVDQIPRKLRSLLKSQREIENPFYGCEYTTVDVGSGLQARKQAFRCSVEDFDDKPTLGVIQSESDFVNDDEFLSDMNPVNFIADATILTLVAPIFFLVVMHFSYIPVESFEIRRAFEASKNWQCLLTQTAQHDLRSDNEKQPAKNEDPLLRALKMRGSLLHVPERSDSLSALPSFKLSILLWVIGFVLLVLTWIFHAACSFPPVGLLIVHSFCLAGMVLVWRYYRSGRQIIAINQHLSDSWNITGNEGENQAETADKKD